MAAYAVVTLTISDQEKFDAYRARAGQAMEKHGITALQVSKDPQRLEGNDEAPQLVVLLTAENRENFQKWHADPEFSDLHAMRRASGKVTLILL